MGAPLGDDDTPRLLEDLFGFGAAPFLIAIFATHAVSMLLPHKLPYPETFSAP